MEKTIETLRAENERLRSLAEHPTSQHVQAIYEISKLQEENERLRRDLMDPPADVQEAVIKKLNLVSGDVLKENERLKAEVEAWRKEVEGSASGATLTTIQNLKAERDQLKQRDIANQKQFADMNDTLGKALEQLHQCDTALKACEEALKYWFFNKSLRDEALRQIAECGGGEVK